MRYHVFQIDVYNVALVRTDVSEERSASIRVTRIDELGTKLAVTVNQLGIYSQRASVASYS
jgi:putative ubiquitin-RnfH superfamily antitoxin RatB of RatAB toxin-antitoxin module